MSFVNASLLFGGLLIAVPVVLHLIMRRRPQRVVFPALRYVRSKRDANRRRLRLRHLLLLALRCAVIGLLAFALSRPSLKGSGIRGKEGAPIAAALVVDNSLRMAYRHENATRLDAAQELAAQLLQQLPEDTAVAACDLSGGRPAFAADLGAAQQRLARLTPAASTGRLTDRIGDAIRLLQQKEDHRQELFVFTDLAAAAWTEQGLRSLAEQLDAAEDVAIYVVDVGVSEPENFGLGPIRFSDQVISRDTVLKLQVPLIRTGADAELPVELFLRDADTSSSVGEVKKGHAIFSWSASATGEAEFSLSRLGYGTHQGLVRVVGEDGLPIDNSRYFTIQVDPPRRVLLASQTPRQAVFVLSALSTSGRFDCQVEPFDRITGVALDAFSAVFLLDPPPLPPTVWQNLDRFTTEGGGVVICLGHEADRDPFNGDAPQLLLAGKLRFRSRSATYLNPTTFDHPIVAKFRPYAGQTPWRQFPVEKFWLFDSLSPGSATVLYYANGLPAILERPIGAGHALTMTTPVSDPAFHPDREVWNLLPTGLSSDAWPFWLLVNEMAAYLTGGADDRVNYLAGETASLHLGPGERRAIHDAGGFAVLPPVGEGVRRTLPRGRDTVTISATDALGNYRVTAGGQAGALKRGFSVNADPDVSRLSRTTNSQIAEALGEDRVRFARDASEIEVSVGLGRDGHELYSWIIALVALALAAEFLLANRFYREAA